MAEVSGEISKVSWGEDATLEELRKPYKVSRMIHVIDRSLS